AAALYEEKRLEPLKEAVPRLSHVSCLCGVDPPSSISEAARQLGVRLQFLEVRSPDDFDSGLAAAASEAAGGLLVGNVQWFNNQLPRIADQAAKRKLPAIAYHRAFVEAGGLLSYGPKPGQNIPRVAAYANRILRGARPADLPVEQPTLFALGINLKTAKALGLTVPPAEPARAGGAAAA